MSEVDSRWKLRGLGVPGLAAAALLAGCASDGSDARHPYDARGGACMAYPDVGYRVFPYDASASTRVWPSCSSNCKVVTATAGTDTAPLDQALPAGPCDDEGATCQSMAAGWTPPCRESGGPGNAYVCTCRGHAWHCAISAQGGSVGDPPSCLGVPETCRSVTRTATEVCACGTCFPLCTSDADCRTGSCRKNALCFPTASSCPGPDECPTACTGFCR